MNNHAWAIDTQSHEGHGLLGKYWWFFGPPPKIPASMDGYTTAVFKTRAIAREALHSAKRTFPRAKVVKVYVDISTA